VLGKFPTCRRSLFLLALEQLSGAFGRYIGSALGVIARFVSLTPGFVFVNEAAVRPRFTNYI
jgi:hypothetical protein